MIILLCVLASVGLIASYLDWASARNAPVGYEDEDGFHVVRCDECDRFKKSGPQRLCVLGYPTRASFFTGRRPTGGRPVQGFTP